ncbi:hypothetical protein ABID21_000547 [Pseudorhizobium tarimense]|uniref:Nutrient deprivation-induced protein n=1 Tax=Pseudorhizobium tarimense TaxID=1079109 RepID=A0ABV2H2A2_9HYPH
MTSSDTKRAEELEHEIAQDRLRIEERMDAIQAKMSPGQILDEAIQYAKSSGGSEYISNLGNAMKTNPIPVALMGISMAWLMANPGATRRTEEVQYHDDEYPLAQVTGTVRRVGPVKHDGESRYSHFTDEAGKRYRALTDESGRRAGHFMDEAGKTYRGFADATGRQVHDIRDEAGRLFDEASGWISKTWRQMGSSASRAGSSVMGGARSVGNSARSVGNSAMSMGSSVRGQAGHLNDTIARQFQDQPLIGGALAFALGAAIGAALPNTRRENEALGETAEGVRKQMAGEASKAMHKVEEAAADVYDRASNVASEMHDTARDRIADEARNYQRANGDGRDTRAN